MGKNRLEAFSDGVIAIIITIMVLELKVPHGDQLSELAATVPVMLGYVLSFIYVGIYWNNHHHLFHVARHVNGAVLWGNLHLLFWLSIIPFVTSWMGQHYASAWPVAAYGIVLMMSGAAYYLLTQALISLHGRDSAIARALGNDFKGKASVAIYLIAIGLAFVQTWLSLLLYTGVALLWIVPDRRMERVLKD
ncbi:MAG TPA: TMEM175 family protein [Burkholderiaceae bacterium]